LETADKEALTLRLETSCTRMPMSSPSSNNYKNTYVEVNFKKTNNKNN